MAKQKTKLELTWIGKENRPKLDRWSEDLKQGLEREIKEIDKQIREARKTAALEKTRRARN